MRTGSEYHEPVLSQACIEGLSLKPDGIYGPLTASALKSRVPGAPSAMFLPRKPKTPSGRFPNASKAWGGSVQTSP